MTARTLQIKRVARLPKFSGDDQLLLSPGVNVIVGEKDAGKTKWLRMLDYLMGSPDKPQDEFGEDLAIKYHSLQATIVIDHEEIRLERRWHEEGSKTKVFVNDEVADDFSQVFLEKLNIPILHFPKGNPFADRGWPVLSWRMLLRHIYRQERFWGDFAERQPPGEQHACLAQFLGVAEVLYPPQYGELIRRQKELGQLLAQKESYARLLHSITTGLLSQKEISVAVTEESIRASEERLAQELEALNARRTEIVEAILAKQKIQGDKRFEELQEHEQSLKSERMRLLAQRIAVSKRHKELMQYASVVDGELNRFERIKTSAPLLADLKVTQCPVCDQEVTPNENSDVCYLCGKLYIHDDDGTRTGVNRLQFEEDRVREEAQELRDLVENLGKEIQAIDTRVQEIDITLQQAEGDLAPARQLATTMIPPDLPLMDQRAGSIREQLQQLQRVRRALDLQRELEEKILALKNSEADLTRKINEQNPDVNFGQLSQTMEDGMNNYLNAINAGGQKRWDHGRISFTFRERDFQVRVKDRRWDTQIGATSQAIVLFAYHYALLSLVGAGNFNYPGLVIIDFPVQLVDGTSVADKENYLIEPFVKLCQKASTAKTQLVAAGRSFEGLVGAKRIVLAGRNQGRPGESKEA
jgi:hypothetical protein